MARDIAAWRGLPVVLVLLCQRVSRIQDRVSGHETGHCDAHPHRQFPDMVVFHDGRPLRTPHYNLTPATVMTLSTVLALPVKPGFPRHVYISVSRYCTCTWSLSLVL